MILPASRKPFAGSSRKPDGDVPRRWLAMARGGWIVLALLLLASFIVSIPAYYRILQNTCNLSTTQCLFWQPTPGNIIALQRLHLPVAAYAAYFVSLDAAASLLFWIVGILIFWRKSDEWIGVSVSLVLIIFGSFGISDTLQESFRTPQTPLFIQIPIVLIALLQWPALGIFLLTFPTGRFAPRWSWLIVLLWIGQLGFFFSTNFSTNFVPVVANFLLLVLFVTWGSTLGIQVYRYVCVYNTVQRQQVKWFMFALFAGLSLVVVGNGILGGLVAPLNAPDSWFQLLNGTFIAFLFMLLPLSIGIAILRYRLWDIDLIINRTLVYGALTLSVIGVYVLVVVGLGALIQVQGNVLLSLLATGLIAVLFQPLRLRLQRGVNRLMYGERDDPYVVLSRLGNRLEATLVPEKVLPTIVETVAHALKLPYVAIALLPEQHPVTGTIAGTTGAIAVAGTQEAAIVASYGAPTADPLRMPLVYQAETIGYLLLAARAGDTFGKADSRLLTDLARQAGVAVYAVRLTTHLQHLTESLQQARERLVTTREEERRRLRRDLHDGLGPALASLTFKVDAARNLLAQDTEKADRLLDSVRQQAQEAIIDIRRLVYNLRPPALDELGLLSALHEQAAHYQHQGLKVDVDTPEALPSLPAAVEVAAYRIAQEALTNVAQHAGAQRCLLRLSIDAEVLQLDISDDGQGIPVGHHIGVGLHTMHERANELGGSCTITRGSFEGTTIQVRLPLAAGSDALPTSAQEIVQSEQENTLTPDVSLVRQEE
jgi:signal transduction histidine kinase